MTPAAVARTIEDMTSSITASTPGTSTFDGSLRDLASGARRWAERGLPERGRLLLATHRSVAGAAADWARTACRIKGIDGPLAGEEWLSGPYAVLTALDAYARTLGALIDGRSPVDGCPIVDAPGGRRAVRVLPYARSDRLLLSGYRADVWFPPGVDDRRIRATAGGSAVRGYRYLAILLDEPGEDGIGQVDAVGIAGSP